ncbi:DUF7408 domain-containing protein [Dictyobacter arantiisoli]|uniref:Uncharacterized protein n=1 Tax=Dictyobacter arantiisoli TaxID=2014874 RepID=A0A5A5TBL3_9CHLR|nr:hypothetical protein [Dictyobacter arantiisoli]GCF08880.1 hypothetical protein KDI_24440 [Dictyobacter arantiisoli]
MLYIGVFVIVFLPGLFLPASVAAKSSHNTSKGPSILKVSMGFDGTYEDGNWVPIQIALANSGSDFTGKIAVSVPNTPLNGINNMTMTDTYQENINLPPGSQKQVSLSVPLNLSLQGATAQISVDLLDSAGHNVVHKTLSPMFINTNLTLVGVLSDTPNNFNQLNLALSSLFSTQAQTKNLTAATMPTQAAVLNNFNLIVIDNYTTANLSQSQLNALQSWVNQGGNLIVTGGPEWKRTLSKLPSSLLPVSINGTGNLSAGTHLLPVNAYSNANQAPQDTLSATLAVSQGKTAANSTTLLAAGQTPLITQKILGQGTTYYLAYDPTLEPLASWSKTSQIWSSILYRALGDRSIANTANSNAGPVTQWQTSSYDSSSLITLLQSFFPNAYPSVWLVLVLLLSYVLILGPIRLLIIRVLKRKNWSWRIALTTIAAFTLLSYGLALQQKGSAIINSSITVVQLNTPDQKGNTVGQVTTFVGVFVPSQGDFQVHVPGSELVQSAQQNNYNYSYNPSRTNTNQQSTFTQGNNSTDVDLQGVDIWTTRTLVAQHDYQTTGGITSQLQLHQNSVSGTVTNTLPYALTDTFVILGNNYVALGDLPANATKQVSLKLTSNSSTNNTRMSGSSLTIADQIANSRGLSASGNMGPYYSNAPGSQLQDMQHRHALMLEAMSGGTCDNNNNCYHQNMPNVPIMNKNGIIVKRMVGATTSSNRDPLLLPGTTATIIGWAQNTGRHDEAVTVNGQITNGSQETLVQAPLNVNYIGAVQIPSSAINSQVVHLEQGSSGSIQEPAPGYYMLSNGSMTIEYSMSGTTKLQNSSLAFSSSNNAINMITSSNGINAGATTNINRVQTYLYNWRTKTWDPISFSEYACTVSSAQDYIGPDGRVLLHLSNHDGNAIFDKPALEIQGTVTH